LPVSIHPIGAITKNNEGKELAEMYDMHASGAVAFGDGSTTVQSSGLLLKALQYVKAINKTIIQIPNDKSIAAHGLMNESVVSTRLGLPGLPAIAEELMIVRDIELARYTSSKIHFTGITTAQSVKLIREAKAAGVQVSCSVSPAHLFFTEDDLEGYDTNLKLDPPLRNKADQQALIDGLADGTIDCIASHHLPQDIDHKIVEFEYAKHGMVSLQTSFAAVRTVLSQLSIEDCIKLFSSNPRQIFGMPSVSINKEQAANLTLFLPDETWEVKELHSRSKNSAFLGKQLKGKPVGIINKEKVFLND
jgi:dihydroorotase